jgi:hypothetical protein
MIAVALMWRARREADAAASDAPQATAVGVGT